MLADVSRERISRRLAAAVMALLAAAPVAAAQAAPTEPLGATGRWITDAEGRVVVLHGINLVAKRAPHLPSDAGFGTDDAGYLASEGFNTLRLGFRLRRGRAGAGRLRRRVRRSD